MGRRPKQYDPVLEVTAEDAHLESVLAQLRAKKEGPSKEGQDQRPHPPARPPPKHPVPVPQPPMRLSPKQRRAAAAAAARRREGSAAAAASEPKPRRPRCKHENPRRGQCAHESVHGGHGYCERHASRHQSAAGRERAGEGRAGNAKRAAMASATRRGTSRAAARIAD